MTKKYLALGLAGPHLIELTQSPALMARWDTLPVAFSVLGIDRVDGSPVAPVTLASSAVGATLAGATRHGRFLITATPQRDHPYNIARRVASLAHLSKGRSGLLLGTRDPYAPHGPGGGAPAVAGSGLGRDLPLTAQTAYDAAFAVRALEQSWPYDTIVGDREKGILVESNRIVRVDINNAFSIAGPLNIPESPFGPSVLAWYAASAGDLPREGVGQPIDLVLGAEGTWPVVTMGAEPPERHLDGIVLRPRLEQSVDGLLDIAERWLSRDFTAIPVGGSLREALDLAAPPPLSPTLPAVFAEPQPHASL